jgi:hypothetical protein
MRLSAFCNIRKLDRVDIAGPEGLASFEKIDGHPEGKNCPFASLAAVGYGPRFPFAFLKAGFTIDGTRIGAIADARKGQSR